jgi:hypothetical protein
VSLPWFRMYSEFATDTKVQSMSEVLQRRLVMLFCLQCSGELEKLDDDELACALRIAPDELTKTMDVFKRKGFLGPDGKIAKWDKRQFKSDSSTERVRAHRATLQEQTGNGDETFHVTPPLSPSRALPLTPQTDQQITDTDKTVLSAAPTASAKVSRVPVPAEWFLEFKLAYPDRDGDQKWHSARKAANARISEGHTPQEMIDGARRYAEWCKARGKVGTEGVKMAASFLGPEKSFLEEWPLTASPAATAVVTHQQRERGALKQLMDRREAIGIAGFRDPRQGETSDQYRKAQDDEWNRRKGAPPPAAVKDALSGALPKFGGHA